MKKILFIAAVALAAAACSKTFDTNPAAGKAIGFTSWNETMTKAKTAFVTNDEFDVFGYKTAGSTNTTVFDGVDVKFDGTDWSYSPLRFWDQNTDSYTFFAAYPKNVVTGSASLAQDGLFTVASQAYDGENEKVLVAQKKTVTKANSEYTKVNLVFKHAASLVDVRVKKHLDIESAVLTINSLALSNIKVNGSYEVTGYANADDNANFLKENDPIGVWTPAAGVNPDATPYKIASASSLEANKGASKAEAAKLINNLVVMPQALNPATDKPTITINYTITTGTGSAEDSMTYNEVITIDQFDKTDNESNTAEFITAWKPGVHYTYYITINANAITFDATIADWDVFAVDGYHYIIN